MVCSPAHSYRQCILHNPPKLSKSAKEDLIVAHLRSTRTCHTLKDLEKMLPSVASINGMQVKEYIQNLTDENKIRVEKIGSGNWYWCFGGDETREREGRLQQLQKEVSVLQASYEEAAADLAAKRAQWDQEGGGDEGENRAERGELMHRRSELQTERTRLQAQWLTATTTVGGKSVAQMKEETETFRQQALMWTDNIYVLEEYMGKLTGGDREIMTAVQREYYGDEYVEGEGLRELIS
ncbi:putative GAJ protein [Aspergillus clavatus NRRL 1]|uniref:Meiotic nuclear division protein 1 n=1 Tax=Aspergillus clavatus (strain ATCC 1007 / CBS 513.65 / DSM 816 / NCTC 3887 / NRRL 1 / QM 1276 / 107) TaxID=344612 RepID=A1CHR5_ASPCL|nr:GAJ protein, putative [Aspergillus clavatus NRRL 1]EAW10420.1 GAJ protein, putative [Aspergillus clavatus NRRL 1]